MLTMKVRSATKPGFAKGSVACNAILEFFVEKVLVALWAVVLHKNGGESKVAAVAIPAKKEGDGYVPDPLFAVPAIHDCIRQNFALLDEAAKEFGSAWRSAKAPDWANVIHRPIDPAEAQKAAIAALSSLGITAEDLQALIAAKAANEKPTTKKASRRK